MKSGSPQAPLLCFAPPHAAFCRTPGRLMPLPHRAHGLLHTVAAALCYLLGRALADLRQYALHYGAAEIGVGSAIVVRFFESFIHGNINDAGQMHLSALHTYVSYS